MSPISFLPRLGAFCLDHALACLLGAFAANALGAERSRVLPPVFAAIFLYQAILLAAFGRTPGLIVANARVENDTGGKITPLRALGRAAALTLSLALLGLGVFIFIRFPGGRAAHDALTQSRIVAGEPLTGPRKWALSALALGGAYLLLMHALIYLKLAMPHVFANLQNLLAS